MTTSEQRPGLGAGSIDIGAIRDRTAFATALTELRERAGLTVRDVARASGVPTATLGGYFSGRHLPQVSQQELFFGVLSALRVSDEDLAAWWEALLRVRQGASAAPSPYRGLEGYDVADADVFVGRESLVGEVCARIREAAATGTPTVLTLVGVSGTGKSSLMRAGVMATLAREGWDVAVLATGRGLHGQDLHDAVAASRASGRPLVLGLDQFEEVFAPEVEPADRDRFLAEMDHVVRAEGPPVVVVLTLRADFFAAAMAEPLLVERLGDGAVFVGPMATEDLRRVITDPAERAGRAVEPALVELILRDIRDRRASSTHSSLPLLAHALVATWGRAATGILRAGDYVEAGGLAGAVQQTAEDAYGRLSASEQEQARRLFAELVSVDEEGAALRRRVSHAELGSHVAARAVVDAFVGHRLLTASEDALEISHDIVLEAWPRLRRWIEDDRGRLRVRRRVSVAAAAWERDGRHAGDLLQGPLLGLVRELGDGLRLPASEQEFVDESIRADQARSAAGRRRRRLIAGLAGVTTVLAVVATTLSIYLAAAVARSHRDEVSAQAARRSALSRDIALESANLSATDPALAAQLAVVAERTSPTLDARSAVLAASGDPLMTRLVGPRGVLDAFASPDARTLATIASDGGVRFYARGTTSAPHLVATLHVDHGNQMFAGAFSPSGRLFVAAGYAGDVSVIDLSARDHPRVVGTLGGPKSSIQHLAFSPDGSTLYAAASDPALFRWSVTDSTFTALPTVTGFGGGVHAVAVSPAGLVATGSADATVRLWRPHGSGLQLVQAVKVAGDTTDTINTVTFSPDGKQLAAGATDESVRIWAIGGGDRLRPVTTLGGFTSWVNGLAFSPDGTLLAAAASGARVQVWHTSGWQVAQSWSGPANYTSAEFVAGSDLLLTGGLDGVTRLRTLTGPRLTDLQDVIGASTQTADGSQLWVAPGPANPVVAQVRRTGPLRYQETGLVLRAPAQAGGIDQVVAVSPDGSELVAGTGTGHLVVWHVDGAGAHEVGVLDASPALIEQVASAPTGAGSAPCPTTGRSRSIRRARPRSRRGRPSSTARG